MESTNQSLDHGFTGSIPQTDDDVRRGLVAGLLSLDANVLLNFYRYTPSAQEALLEVLRAVGDRLWVSHQAAREFWRNRCAAIDGRNEATNAVLKSLEDRERATLESLNAWAKNTAVSEETKQSVIEKLTSGFAEARELIEAEVQGAGQVTYDSATDSVVEVLTELLEGRVGPPLSTTDHAKAVEEAKRRIDAQIPPGYRDAAKESGQSFDGGAGDYLVWVQSMAEAKRRDMALVIVTGDEKEDWWWKHRSTFMGPRSELIDEFVDEVSHELFMLRPIQLIEHAEALNVTVSQEAASDVARGSSDLGPPRWTAEAVNEILRRLDDEDAVQGDVIRFAAEEGGLIDRSKIYEICGFSEDRMLRGFTRPTARISRDLQAEGLLEVGVEPMLTPIYDGVIAVKFEIPLDVVEILAVGSGADGHLDVR